MERDEGVSAVLGGIMMLAIMMTLIPGAILLRAAISEEMSAQREAAERAAWCARHVEIGPPDCPQRGPLPGYECVEAELEVWLCSRPPTVSVPTPTVTPPISVPTVTTPDLGI